MKTKSKRRIRQSATPTDRGSRRGRPKGTGSHTIYSNLRQRILRLDLAPGADIDEQTLVRQFKLSRTPVREGLLRLAHEGLVEIIPNRGARVAALNFHEVAEIFDALEIGIRITSRWAALRHATADLDAIRLHSRNFADAAANGDFHRMTEANRDYHRRDRRSRGKSTFRAPARFASVDDVALRVHDAGPRLDHRGHFSGRLSADQSGA